MDIKEIKEYLGSDWQAVQNSIKKAEQRYRSAEFNQCFDTVEFGKAAEASSCSYDGSRMLRSVGIRGYCKICCGGRVAS